MRSPSMSGVDDCLLFKTEEERRQWYRDAAKYWQVFVSHVCIHICIIWKVVSLWPYHTNKKRMSPEVKIIIIINFDLFTDITLCTPWLQLIFRQIKFFLLIVYTCDGLHVIILQLVSAGHGQWDVRRFLKLDYS